MILFRQTIRVGILFATATAFAAGPSDSANQASESDTGAISSALSSQRKNQVNDAVLRLEDANRDSNRQQGWWNDLHAHPGSDARAANLAAIYQDAGMERTVGLWAAARAINTAEYASFAPHLFLASAYSPLRDPRRVDQRVDTLWTGEYLLANLLAPVDAGTFSPYFAQPESWRPGGRPLAGVSSETEYFSNGGWRETAVVDGRSERLSYAFETDYRSEPGYRQNNDFEQRILSLKTRIAITKEDSLYFQVSTLEANSGDLLQYYDPATAQLNRRMTETQEPVLLVGYHHEWSPQSHTLFLAGRVHDRTDVTDPNQPVLLVQKDLGGTVTGGPLGLFDFTVPRPQAAMNYQREFVSYLTEVQHVLESENHSTEVGARFQTGTIESRSSFGASTPTFMAGPDFTNTSTTFASTPSSQNSKGDYQRYAVYGYHQWKISDDWLVTGGLAYEKLTYPQTFLDAPVADGEESDSSFSPKAGFVWTPTKNATLRAAFSQSQGSILVDQDYRLEPAQVAGFNQSLRNVIPQSLTDGPLADPMVRTWHVSYEQRLWERTFVGIYGEVYIGEATRRVGAFDVTNPGPTPTTTMSEHITFSERDLTLSLNQLVGDCAALGVIYRVVDADQTRELQSAAFRPDIGSTLHQVTFYAAAYHESGLFGRFQALWSQQSNRAYVIDPPGDEFMHFDVYVGYRFPKRQAEIRIGLLNLTDRNYKIAPLDLTQEIPRARTLTAMLKFAF